MTEDFHSLKALSRFSLCNDEDLRLLAQSGVVKSFKKGDCLFQEGNQPECFSVIKHGFIKMTKHTNQQTNLLLLFGPGKSVGEVALIVDCPYPATATCLVDSEILLIPKNQYLKLKNRSSNFLESIALQSGNMALTLGAKHLEFIEGEVSSRIMSFLAGLFKSFGQKLTPEQTSLPFVLTRSEIASAVGTRTETASRFLSNLRKNGDFQTTDTQMIGRNKTFSI